MRADPADDAETEPDDAVEQETDWHWALNRMGALVMRLAEAIVDEATAPAEAAPAAEEVGALDDVAAAVSAPRVGRAAAAAAPLARMARALRLTAALDKRLRQAPVGSGSAGGAPVDYEAQRREAAEYNARSLKHLWDNAGRTMVRNSVALAIETEAEAGDRERLFDVLKTVLAAREDEYAEQGPPCYEEIIVGLCQELGLTARRLGLGYGSERCYEASAVGPASGDRLARAGGP